MHGLKVAASRVNRSAFACLALELYRTKLSRFRVHKCTTQCKSIQMAKLTSLCQLGVPQSIYDFDDDKMSDHSPNIIEFKRA